MSTTFKTAKDTDIADLEALFLAVKGRDDDDCKSLAKNVIKSGHCEVAIIDGKIVCAVSAIRLGVLASLSHTLTDLFVAIHPNFLNNGLVKEVLIRFLEVIQKNGIFQRVEVMVCASNVGSIEFYESIGFKKQGRFEKRIKTKDGWEDDIAMAWMHYGDK